MIWKTGVMISILSMFCAQAWACEACQGTWDFKKTAEHADAVIVGQKVGEQRAEKPEWIDVNVLQVLKGGISEKKIRISSWYGMCSYGIQADDKRYVVLLVKPSQGHAYYDAVNYGCAVKALPVDNGSVQLYKEWIPVSALPERWADKKDALNEFLTTDFKSVAKFKDLPENVRKNFLEGYDVRYLVDASKFIADPGERFNSVDTIEPGTPSDTPFRRLLVAGISLGQCFVYYEQGGRGYSRHLIVYDLTKNAVKRSFSGHCFEQNVRDVGQLKALIKSGGFREETKA